MTILESLSTLSVIIVFVCLEVYFYYHFHEISASEHWSRFNVEFGCFTGYGIVAYVALIFFDSHDLRTSIIITAFIILYIAISEFVLYKKPFRTRIVWNTHKITIIFVLLITFIFLMSFSVLHQSALKASLVEGAVFSTADWFTEIFVSFINGEDVASIISLMTIGALVLIVAKARGSAGFSVAGFMLVIFLPIFSVFDKIFTGINEIQFIAPVLYEIFVNPALCLFIYVILMLVFYFLLCSIILLFISMMPRSPFGGDD